MTTIKAENVVMRAFLAAAYQWLLMVRMPLGQFNGATAERAVGGESHQTDPLFAITPVHLELARIFQKCSGATGGDDHAVID